MNGKKPLTLDLKTFIESTGLDYMKDTYVSHPSTEEVKAELAKIVDNPILLDRTPVLKTAFLVAWRILLTFVVQVLGGNYSSTEQVNLIQQLFAYYLLTGTKVDIGEIIYSDLVTRLTNKSRQIYVSYPRSVLCALAVGPEALGLLLYKRKKPKSKKTPTETKVTTPKPMEGSEQSHSVSSGTVPDPQDPERNIQLAGMGLPSTLDEGTRKSQPLPEGTNIDPKDSWGKVQPTDRGFPSMASNEGTAKTTPFPERPRGDKDSEGLKPPADKEPQTNPVVDPSRTDANGVGYRIQLKIFADVQALLLSDDEMIQESDDEEVFAAIRLMRKKLTKDQWAQHEEAAVSYADLRTSIEGYYEENIDDRDQTDKLVQATMNSLDKTSTNKTNLLKALTEVTETLKVIKDAVKDDPTLNKKVIEATEDYTKNSTTLTELLTLVKNFNFQGLKSLVEFLHATALKQEEHLSSWVKSSISMAWNLGPRMTAVESSKAEIRFELSSLRQDTSDVKSMMTEIYQAFKVVIEEPPSHTEGETEDIETQDTNTDKVEKEQVSEEPKHDVPISSIATDDQPEQTKLVKASSIVCTDPDAPILVSYTINGKIFYLTEELIQAHLDKEDHIKKAKEEAKRLAMTKTAVIKIVQEEAEKIGIDLKKVISAKAGEKLKPEPITDVKIHPNSKLAVLIVYRNNDKRNSNVHNPFKFADFGITELDELGPIIQKKKNTIVKDLMTSLGKSSCPDKDQSQPLRRKRKHMELEPEMKVPGLEYNRSLPEGIPFVNNMVIEEPEYGIFFTDVFGDQAFQRWNDIHKVRMESLVSYLVMASMVRTPENDKFGLKLRKLIAEHPDQEKLKSKKVKLEALGYKLD
ncbi:hypothetical protein Tco_0675372 [Tanacetum coccineum]